MFLDCFLTLAKCLAGLLWYDHTVSKSPRYMQCQSCFTRARQTGPEPSQLQVSNTILAGTAVCWGIEVPQHFPLEETGGAVRRELHALEPSVWTARGWELQAATLTQVGLGACQGGTSKRAAKCPLLCLCPAGCSDAEPPAPSVSPRDADASTPYFSAFQWQAVCLWRIEVTSTVRWY